MVYLVCQHFIDDVDNNNNNTIADGSFLLLLSVIQQSFGNILVTLAATDGDFCLSFYSEQHFLLPWCSPKSPTTVLTWSPSFTTPNQHFVTNDDAATILVLHCSHLETALVWFGRVSTLFLPTEHCCCWKSFAAGTTISQIVQLPSVLASILVTLAATTSNFTYFLVTTSTFMVVDSGG